jgi:transglutaminase-like putative cysteine protease
MRGVVGIAIAIAACGPARVPRLPLPALEAARDNRAPIDPYGAELEAHGFVGDHIPSDAALGDPGAIVELTVRVDHAATGEQRRVDIRIGPGAPVGADERQEALRASDDYDLGDPEIQRAAHAATAGVRDDRDRVAALVAFVYGHVRYEHADERVASVVLSRGSGDCSEMSLLFVALARAVHVPARRVVGLAATYVGGEPAFGLHAWAEVALDGRWQPVDPTWNEPIADATHVPLYVGDGTGWVRELDDLELAVLGYERDESLDGRADIRRLVGELR